jgi:hypothetical protein
MKIFILFSFLVCFQNSHGQQPLDTNLHPYQNTSIDYTLVIEKRQGNHKKRYLVDKHRIKVFKRNGEHYSGKLHIVSEDTLLVGETPVAFSEISRINIFSPGLRATGILTGVFWTTISWIYVSNGVSLFAMLPFPVAFTSIMFIPRRYDIVGKYHAYFLKSVEQ